ncbi:uncharacterized protein LOC111519328 [Drosophila willistoni]|uniref:uncharacterized protein LOC111519328 n=1 Tax=Drosophila willistoni TaxID=7260 RepID=UPI001F07561E|nr:uncharacterized protein LOC111519328 [Drosophila willistoni]
MFSFKLLSCLIIGTLVLMLITRHVESKDLPFCAQLPNVKAKTEAIKNMKDESHLIPKTVPLSAKQQKDASQELNGMNGDNKYFDNMPILDLKREFSSDESNPYIENVRHRYEILAGGYADIVR